MILLFKKKIGKKKAHLILLITFAPDSLLFSFFNIYLKFISRHLITLLRSKMAGRLELLTCALYLVVYFQLQSQDVARDFGAVCTPEFFLFKKVKMYLNNLHFSSMVPQIRPCSKGPVL